MGTAASDQLRSAQPRVDPPSAVVSERLAGGAQRGGSAQERGDTESSAEQVTVLSRIIPGEWLHPSRKLRRVRKRFRGTTLSQASLDDLSAVVPISDRSRARRIGAIPLGNTG